MFHATTCRDTHIRETSWRTISCDQLKARARLPYSNERRTTTLRPHWTPACCWTSSGERNQRNGRD